MATSRLSLMLFLVAVFFFIRYGDVQGAVFRDCGTTIGKVLAVNVIGCTNKTRCILTRNTNETIEIIFQTTRRVDTVEASVAGIISNIVTPFPMSDKNACHEANGGLDCPIIPGKTYTYRNKIFVESFYPKLSLTVRWHLIDGADPRAKVACILTPVKIDDVEEAAAAAKK